ncbi:MAG: IPT/TIG domain-containing protein, partial [Chloroflexi bacterium]|nr:IPT/TIG domain-containing protein [Chloroflexota bacterium]
PVRAQGEVYLRTVEPATGSPGQELELTLQGGGFGGANEVRVTIGELEILEAWVESDQVVRARVFIPEDARPGPRRVEVVASFGQNEDFSAVLPGGFSVLESGPPGPDDRGGESRQGDDGYDPGGLWWLVILGVAVIVLVGVALAVTVAVKARRPALQQQEQTEAQKENHSQECQPGTHKTVREELELKPGRWKVTGLKVTLYDSSSGERGTARDVPSDLADRVDKAARRKLLRGESEPLVEQATEIARELAALIVAWQSLSETERDVFVEPHIEGGEASAKFVRYRCVGKPGRWQEESEWEVELRAVDHFPTTFRGPEASESPTAYRALLEAHLGVYVRDLIREVGRLF